MYMCTIELVFLASYLLTLSCFLLFTKVSAGSSITLERQYMHKVHWLLHPFKVLNPLFRHFCLFVILYYVNVYTSIIYTWLDPDSLIIIQFQTWFWMFFTFHNICYIIILYIAIYNICSRCTSQVSEAWPRQMHLVLVWSPDSSKRKRKTPYSLRCCIIDDDVIDV